MRRSAKRGFAATVLAALLMVGCGGGADGGGDTGDETTEVTESSAKEMAGALADSTNILRGLAEVSASVLEEAGGAMEAGGGLGRPAGVQVTIPVNSVCSQGGSASLTASDVAPENEFSSGDQLSVLFENCAMGGVGDAVTLNGTMSMTAGSTVLGTFGSPPFQIGVTISFEGFSFQTSTESGSVNGSFTFTLASDDGDAVMFTLASDHLTITENGTTETLSDFSVTLGVTQSTEAYSFSLDGTLQSERIRGVSVETLDPFEGTGNDNPTSGTMVITDSSTGAEITFQVVDDVNVDLLVDKDGDGATDFTVHTTWDELEGA